MKSKLLEVLEKDTDPVEHVPESAVWIIDLMALIHSLVQLPDTFEDLAVMILSKTLMHSTRNSKVGIVAVLTNFYQAHRIQSSSKW